MPARFAVALLLEIVYAVFTRTWLRAHASGIELELWVTACRLVSLAAYGLLFRDLLRQPPCQPTSVRAVRATPLLFAGLLPLLLVPLLFYGGYSGERTSRIVFAVTSIAVALREEVFYRGILLSLLARRLGFAKALVVSNILFVLYHYGAQPLYLVGTTEIFVMGCVLGLLYQATGTLLAPIALHAIYDALWSLGPIVMPLPDIFRIPLHLLGLVLIVSWMKSQKSAESGALAR